jgi:hypothetical protein
MVDSDNPFVFVVYVTVLSVAQSVYAKIVGRVNNELERMRMYSTGTCVDGLRKMTKKL